MKMKFDQEESDTFSSIHYFAGFNIGGTASKCYKNYANFSDFLIFIVLSATIYQLITFPSEHQDSLSVSFVVCIAYSLALYYSGCFRLQHKKMNELHSLISKTRVSFCKMLDEPTVMKDFKTDLRYSNFYIHFGVFSSFTSAFLFSVQPLLRSAAAFGMDGSKRLQIDTWCPFDFQIPFVFEIMVAIQFITVFWVALRFFANDAFYMFTIKLNVRLFKHLASCGENVLDLNITKERQFINKKWNLSLSNHSSQNEEGNFQETSCDEHQPSHKEFSNLAERKLNCFIKHHQLILSCAKMTCQLYGPVILMYLQSLMGFASVGAFGVLNTKGFEGPQMIAISFFSTANIICMYFMCVACDELARQSGSAADRMIGSPWYVCSREFRTSLVLVLQRFNTRVQASVIGVPTFPLNCVTFVWFLKTLLSLYLFLVQVQGTKKN